MSNAVPACLVLLFCVSQCGCDRKPSLETPVEQSTHDAAGYLIQPEQEFLIKGESSVWRNLFIQFEVNGPEANPFVLTVGNELLPHDVWPLAPENERKQTSSGSLFARIGKEPDRPLAWFSLSSEEITRLADSVRKYFEWSDTAIKENLNVSQKKLIGLTNWQVLQITFSRSKESSNSFMDLVITPNKLNSSSSSLPSYCSITLDKMGVNRLLSVVTNLPSRRGDFIVFKDEQNKIARQRLEAEQDEKVRADNLLN